MLHDACVVNAQKLFGARHHVDVKMFTIGMLFVHEKGHRLVCRSVLEDGKHDLKQSLAQSSRTALGDISSLRIETAELERRSVNACKANERFLVGKERHVANFSNKLRTENRANAV